MKKRAPGRCARLVGGARTPGGGARMPGGGVRTPGGEGAHA
jgi:hypothetical protein